MEAEKSWPDKGCLNCGSMLTGPYCAACGQRAQIAKFTWRYVFTELSAGLFAVDKGILFTLKELFTRPGHMIREFLQGKRTRYFRPIPLLALTAGLYGFIALFFKLEIIGLTDGSEKQEVVKALEWVNSHYALAELALLPILSMGTWAFFKRFGHNYVEHLVANAYLSVQRILVTIVLLPIMFAVNGTYAVIEVGSFGNFISFLLFIWSMVQWFNSGPAAKITLRAIGALVFTYVLLTAVVIAFVILFALRTKLA